jgi:hypothetical protein
MMDDLGALVSRDAGCASRDLKASEEEEDVVHLKWAHWAQNKQDGDGEMIDTSGYSVADLIDYSACGQ